MHSTWSLLDKWWIDHWFCTLVKIPTNLITGHTFIHIAVNHSTQSILSESWFYHISTFTTEPKPRPFLTKQLSTVTLSFHQTNLQYLLCLFFHPKVDPLSRVNPGPFLGLVYHIVYWVDANRVTQPQISKQNENNYNKTSSRPAFFVAASMAVIR